MDLFYHVVLDSQSGTFFRACFASLLDLRKLSEDELDRFNDGADSDRCELGEDYGVELGRLLAAPEPENRFLTLSDCRRYLSQHKHSVVCFLTEEGRRYRVLNFRGGVCFTGSLDQLKAELRAGWLRYG